MDVEGDVELRNPGQVNGWMEWGNLSASGSDAASWIHDDRGLCSDVTSWIHKYGLVKLSS